ncbi:glycosyl transferase family 1 [archaeon SCG-AAA382B04]|nr:glycosyl transferase family 1 [archaeon SCG-AAA382B04]
MNIAIFTDTYFPQINGVTYTISLWKEELEKRGHKVKVFFPKSSYSPKQNEIEIKSISLPFYNGYRIGLPTKLNKYLKNTDTIHTHTPFSLGMIGAYYSKKLNIPRISSYHTPPEDYIDYLPGSSILKFPLIPIYRFWERKFMNTSLGVTAPSKTAKLELEDKGIDNVFVLENGVDTDFFFPTKKTFKEKFEANHLIGYSGRHSKEKNLIDLINVAEKLKDAEVLIAGDGPYKYEYEEMADGIENIHFLGFLDREELPSFYSSLDVFVFPSLAETQGLVGLEANACGTPIVGAREKALKETIIEGVNGYKYEANNISDLYNKIKLCLDKEEELEEKSKKLAEKHSIENAIKKLVNHYKRVIKRYETKKLLN